MSQLLWASWRCCRLEKEKAVFPGVPWVWHYLAPCFIELKCFVHHDPHRVEDVVAVGGEPPPAACTSRCLQTLQGSTVRRTAIGGGPYTSKRAAAAVGEGPTRPAGPLLTCTAVADVLPAADWCATSAEKRARLCTARLMAATGPPYPLTPLILFSISTRRLGCSGQALSTPQARV